MSLTVLTFLLEKYATNPKQIGRLEVGSKTAIDKIKSIKTWLMLIFEKCGNTEVECVDSTNACYGGTAALLNCVLDTPRSLAVHLIKFHKHEWLVILILLV